MKTKLLLICSLLVTCLSVLAADAPDRRPYYRAGEFNLDVYGSGVLKNEDRDPNNVRLGVGVGATYFVTRGLGFGLSAESASTAHSVVDLALGRVIYRAPLNKHWAPYGYIEGGFDFERDIWQAGAGGGLEYRFTRNLGVFGDAGLSVDTDGTGRMRGRTGLRLSF